MASIMMRGIVKDYGAIRAIENVDLDIGDGEFVAFVGPSGCGKSTLLRMIAGLEEITAGELRIGDRVVNTVEPRDRDVAMVFQDYALYPHMTVAQNIGFGLKMRGVGRAETSRRVAEAARMLQIEPLLSRRPSELSGGQRQRVAMGRAIVRRPQVYLFDEPLSNLDAKLRVEMRTEIKRLHTLLQRTTVYVTHDQVEALTLADRIVILNAGRVEQVGKPLDLYNRPVSRFVAEFIGSPQMNMLPAKVGEIMRSVVLDGRFEVPLPVDGSTPGAPLWVGFRPEDVHLSGPGFELPATIEVVEPLGSDIMVTAAAGDRSLTVRLPPDADVARGRQVTLRVAPGKLHVFDAETGRRLPHRVPEEAAAGRQ